MKDQILAEIGFIDEYMFGEISGSTKKTRLSWRRQGKTKYIMYGTQYLYPIKFLDEELRARVAKKYGNTPKPEVL